MISKQNPFSAAFIYTGPDAVSVKAGTTIGAHTYTVDTPVTMPALVAGTDYAIWYEPSGVLVAGDYDTPTASDALRVGGFHYAPGGNAADHDMGGNATPQINPYSLWDLKYRPACADPRGMAKVGNSPFWADIYFLNVNHHANGTSRNNELIATGTNPPERAHDFGGYGASKYKNFIWWNAVEVAAQHGKRLGTYGEHCLAAFGARENIGRGNHPIKTGLNTHNASTWAHDHMFTSKWGVIQAVGCVWVWTESLSDWEGTPATGQYGWEAYPVTGGHVGASTSEPPRGSLIMQNSDDLTALLFGGKSGYTTDICGTRCTETIEKLWDNSENISARLMADHYWQL